jgi:hypothetical protein
MLMSWRISIGKIAHVLDTIVSEQLNTRKILNSSNAERNKMQTPPHSRTARTCPSLDLYDTKRISNDQRPNPVV